MAEAGEATSAEALAQALIHAEQIVEDLHNAIASEGLAIEVMAEAGELSKSLTRWLAKAIRLRLAEAEAEGSHWRWRGWPDYVR
jgi:hypothetical protein